MMGSSMAVMARMNNVMLIPLPRKVMNSPFEMINAWRMEFSISLPKTMPKISGGIGILNLRKP